MSIRLLPHSERAISNKVTLMLLLTGILLIELFLGEKLIASPRLAIAIALFPIFVFAYLKSHTQLTTYLLVLSPIVLIPLFNIKYAIVYIADVLIPVFFVLWLVGMLIREEIRLVPSSLYAPMIALVAAAILATLNSYIFWDISVPTTHRSLFIQLGDITLKILPLLAFVLMLNYCASLREVKFFYVSIFGIALFQILTRVINATLPFIFITNMLLVIAFSMALSQLLLKKHLIGSIEWLALLFMAIACAYFIIKGGHLATMLGLLVAGLVISYLKSKKLFVLLTLAILVSFISVPQFWPNFYYIAKAEGSLSRIPMAVVALNIFKNHFLLGIGPANYHSYAIAHQIGWAFWRTPMTNPHNNYLEILVEMGIVGIGALLWLLLRIFRSLFKAYKEVQDPFQKAFIASTIASFTGFLSASIAGSYLLPGVHSGDFGYLSQTFYIWMLLGTALAIPKITQRHSATPISNLGQDSRSLPVNHD